MMMLCPGKNIRVNVQSDMGSSDGVLAIEPLELLTPVSIPEDAFDGLKRRLGGGFNEVSREIPIPPGANLQSLGKYIRSLVNMAEIESTKPNVTKLVGSLRREMSEEILLISCSLKDPLGPIKVLSVVVNCNDAVLCATLADLIKKHLPKCFVFINVELS
jgi:hypothetical protein